MSTETIDQPATSTTKNRYGKERSLDASIERVEAKLARLKRRQAMSNARVNPHLKKLAAARNALVFFLKQSQDDPKNKGVVSALEAIEKRILLERPSADPVLPFTNE